MLRQKDLKDLAMRHGFGHAMRSKRIDNAERAGRYVAKYVSKAVDGDLRSIGGMPREGGYRGVSGPGPRQGATDCRWRRSGVRR